MSAVTPPEDYDISVINSLIGQRYIERETFDFKGKKAASGSDLAKDFCAMANTSGGIIILGIDEDKNNNVLKGYTKNGFKSGWPKSRSKWGI